MSTLDQIGIPGVGTGILHPKHRYRYRVIFTNPGVVYDNETKLDEGAVEALWPLSMQAIAIDIGAENLLSGEIEHRTNKTVLTFEDDVTNKAIGAVRYWQKHQQTGAKFDLHLDTLDGNEHILDQFVFGNCVMEALQHATWRYDVPVGTSMELYMPRTYVSGVDTIHLDPITRAVLGGLKIEFRGKNPEIPGVCQKLLQIGFETYEHRTFNFTPQTLSEAVSKIQGGSE